MKRVRVRCRGWCVTSNCHSFAFCLPLSCQHSNLLCPLGGRKSRIPYHAGLFPEEAKRRESSWIRGDSLDLTQTVTVNTQRQIFPKRKKSPFPRSMTSFGQDKNAARTLTASFPGAFSVFSENRAPEDKLIEATNHSHQNVLKAAKALPLGSSHVPPLPLTSSPSCLGPRGLSCR